jgi:hypothetical protein
LVTARQEMSDGAEQGNRRNSGSLDSTKPISAGEICLKNAIQLGGPKAI